MKNTAYIPIDKSRGFTPLFGKFLLSDTIFYIRRAHHDYI